MAENPTYEELEQKNKNLEKLNQTLKENEGQEITGFTEITRDITKHKQIEEALIKERDQAKSLLNLYQLPESSIKDLSGFVMNECIKMSESELGFFGFINEDETLMKAHLWSNKAMENCAIDNKPVEFPTINSGIWSEAIREHRPIIVNDYEKPDSRKKGLPEGHVPLSRLISIPIIEEGRAVALVAVANKKQDYSESDVVHLSVFLQNVWGILQRKHAEDALRESETKYRQLFETMMDAYASVDMEGKILETNTSFNKMLGYTAKELQELTIKDFTPERWNSFELDIIEKQVMTRGYSDIYEKEYIHKNGKIFPVELRLFLLRDKNGEVSGVWAIVRDITERKKSEQKLFEMESYQRALLDAVPDTLFLMKPDGTILVANDGLANNLEIPVSKLNDKNAAELVPEDVALRRKEAVDQVLNFGESVTFNDTRAGKNIESRLFPIKDTQGKVTHVAIFARDITERQKAEQERKELEGQLIQAQKMEGIGTLAGGIAHDFNNILSPIMMHSEMALYDLTPDDPLQHTMKEIYKAGERARDLVKQILTFAQKREGNDIVIKASPILKETIKFLRSTIPTTIDIQYNDNAEQDTILADPTQFNQIVMNLCTNAAHAMKEKGGLLDVGLENEDISVDQTSGLFSLNAGRYLKIFVKDNGTGISSDVMKRIFEPYFTTKESGEGTGLGLATVHGIVKNYGGDINVDSSVGQGTIFRVYIPLTDTEFTNTEKDKVEFQTGTEQILLVDDEKTSVDIMQGMLEKFGYKVTARTSSLEALEAFRNNPKAFDLIITDMSMPNMSGDDLAKKIMRIDPEIPIILCTGFSDKIDEVKAKGIGINSFVMKPIVMSDMVKTIRDILNKK